MSELNVQFNTQVNGLYKGEINKSEGDPNGKKPVIAFGNMTQVDTYLKKEDNIKHLDDTIKKIESGSGYVFHYSSYINNVLENLTPLEMAALELRAAQKSGNPLYLRQLCDKPSGFTHECPQVDRTFEILDDGAKYDPRVRAIALAQTMKGAGTKTWTFERLYKDKSMDDETLAVVNKSFTQIFDSSLSDWIRGDFSGSDETEYVNRLEAIKPNPSVDAMKINLDSIIKKNK